MIERRFLRAVGSPYWDARVVNLDTMCCVSILLHLIASLYYNNKQFVEEDLDGAASLDSVLALWPWAAFLP
jgi:hypothetical protein